MAALVRGDGRAGAGPDIDGHEQEQPDNVNEVPVPSCRFETDVTLWGEVAPQRAHQADKQEDGANDDVEAVETGRHEEVRAIDVTVEGELRVAIFVSLEHGKDRTQSNRDDQTVHEVFAVVLMCNRVVRPSRRTPRAQQDQRVDQRAGLPLCS